nr:hypothetical protein [Blastococcus sp. CT_GayMR16]
MAQVRPLTAPTSRPEDLVRPRGRRRSLPRGWRAGSRRWPRSGRAPPPQRSARHAQRAAGHRSPPRAARPPPGRPTGGRRPGHARPAGSGTASRPAAPPGRRRARIRIAFPAPREAGP